MESQATSVSVPVEILRDWGIFDQLHGIDISDDHPASMVFDAVDVAPRADDARYLEWLGAYIGSNRIDVFIPTSEAEILAVTRDPGALADRCTVLVNEPTLAIACLDKHSTLAFLSQNGIDVPEHGLIGHGTAPSRYPVIAKPRSGQGSKGFQTVDSLEMLQSSPAGHVWQECLLPDDQEYTCAVYVTKELATRLLVIKRVLVGGYTGKGEVVDVPVINDYLATIAAAFKTAGCFNVQLRLTDQGPKVFEINPRLSSTLVFRDKLGFQDFRWWLCEEMGLGLPAYEPVGAGARIYRGNYEYILW